MTPLSYKDLPSKQRQEMLADRLDRFEIVSKDLLPASAASPALSAS
jgi:hypothetical protein